MYDSDCANDSFLQSAVKPASGAKDSTMTVGFPRKTTDIFYAGAQRTVTLHVNGRVRFFPQLMSVSEGEANATVAELSFGLLLVLGLWVRLAAHGSAALLALFGIAMAISFGIVSPLNYSVLSACAGALVVAVSEERKKALSRIRSFRHLKLQRDAMRKLQLFALAVLL